MTDQEIIEYFDSTNVTLAELSNITGRTVKSLKKLLVENLIGSTLDN